MNIDRNTIQTQFIVANLYWPAKSNKTFNFTCTGIASVVKRQV